MTRVQGYVDWKPGEHEVLTEEAVAGLVGQRPRLSLGDWQTPASRCEVAAAEMRGNRLLLTFDLPDDAPDVPVVLDLLADDPERPSEWSIGYQRVPAPPHASPIRLLDTFPAPARPTGAPVTTSAPIPGPGFDPQPPPADQHLPSVDREVDAGLAQPFGGPAREEVHRYERVEGGPLTQRAASDLIGEPAPYVEGSDPGEEALDAGPSYDDLATPGLDYDMGMTGQAFAEPGDADHEGPSAWPFEQDTPRPVFVSQHRLEAERLLRTARQGYGDPEYDADAQPHYASSPQTLALLAAAQVEATLAQVEVAEYHASFLQA